MEEAKGAFFGVPMMEALPLVIRRREVWAIGIAMMGMQTAFVGITGYLPTFLRDIGWRPIYADSALSIFTAISAASALPVSLFSDRIGSRKTVLIPSLLLGSASMMCFPLRHTLLLWILILLNGVLRGGLFPLFVALIVEQKGIGPRYAGTAVGTITSLGMLAGFLSQPLGMYFAGTFRGAGAFVVWGVICFVSLFALFLVEEEK
jgi:cyanate permease